MYAFSEQRLTSRKTGLRQAAQRAESLILELLFLKIFIFIAENSPRVQFYH